MNPGPRFQCGLCKKYCKASDRLLECEECKNRFHASCSNLGDNELLRIESGDGAWYCTNCKADRGLCNGAVLKGHKAVRYERCDMWIHNEWSFIAETQYETVNNTNCTWNCPKCEFFNFSNSFFGEQVNLETKNRYVPLTKEKKDRSSPCGTNKSSFISGLKFISMDINSIRGKQLELLAFLDFHQPHVVAIQETKIDSSIATSELFPDTCPYSVYRKYRNIHGGGVMLLVHKDISHMPIAELENDSESIWVKVFAKKTSHFVASWYRSPCNTSEEFQLFREQLDYIRTHHKDKKLPSAHVLGDFNLKDIDWPDRLSKSGSTLSQSEGQILIDIMKRREIKADVRKQHDLCVNNLVGDVKANPRDFYRYINSQKKDNQGIPPLKRKNGKGFAQSDLEKAEEFNVSLRMCSVKMNTPRSRFWIGLHLS